MKRMAAILSVIVNVASAFAKPDDKAFVPPSGAIIDKRDNKIPGLPSDAVIVEEQFSKPARLHYPMIQISNDQQTANLIKPDTGQMDFTA